MRKKIVLPVYEAATSRLGQIGHLGRSGLAALTLALGLTAALPCLAQFTPPVDAALVNEASDALRLKDRKRLAAANATAQAQRYPLAPWIDYWDLGLRLGEVNQSEVNAFYARWPGSYVEDRLRNDWLLELGRRRDWKNFAVDYPRFQMRDDRDVACYGLLTEHLAGRDVRDAARSAWLAQRDGDDGCQLLASTLFEAKQLSEADVWLKIRLSVEAKLRCQAGRDAAGQAGRAELGRIAGQRWALPRP
ncbi:hypothetical protein ACVBEH_14715 [Roseateles sp. GG27B]